MTIKPYQAPWLQKAEKIQLFVGEKNMVIFLKECSLVMYCFVYYRLH